MTEYKILMEFVKTKHGLAGSSDVAVKLGTTEEKLNKWSTEGRVEFFDIYDFAFENLKELNEKLSSINVEIKMGETIVEGIKPGMGISRPASKSELMLINVMAQCDNEDHEGHSVSAITEKQELLNSLKSYFVDEVLEEQFWKTLIFCHHEDTPRATLEKMAEFLCENMEYILQPREASRTILWAKLEYMQQRLLELDKENTLDLYDFKNQSLPFFLDTRLHNMNAYKVISNFPLMLQGIYDELMRMHIEHIAFLLEQRGDVTNF